MAEENGWGDHGARGSAPRPLLPSVIIRLLAAHLEFLVTANMTLDVGSLRGKERAGVSPCPAASLVPARPRPVFRRGAPVQWQGPRGPLGRADPARSVNNTKFNGI